MERSWHSGTVRVYRLENDKKGRATGEELEQEIQCSFFSTEQDSWGILWTRAALEMRPPEGGKKYKFTCSMEI